MTLVKADIGGNISVKFSSSFHDFGNRISHIAFIVQTIDKIKLHCLALCSYPSDNVEKMSCTPASRPLCIGLLFCNIKLFVRLFCRG